jgi:MoxR-like ATPase
MYDQNPMTADAISAFGKRVIVRVARSLGWSGDDARTEKAALVDWLTRRGVTVSQWERAGQDGTPGTTPRGADAGDAGERDAGHPEQPPVEGAAAGEAGDAPGDDADAAGAQADAEQAGADESQAEADRAEADADRQADADPEKQSAREKIERAKRALSRAEREAERAERAADRAKREAERAERKAEREAAKRKAEAAERARAEREAAARAEREAAEREQSEAGEREQSEAGEGEGEGEAEGERQESAPAPAPIRHPIFAKVLALASAGLNVMLVGPAGTGKTTIAHHVADALGAEYGAIHCSAGMSESQLLGYLLPVGESGRFTYVPSRFAELYGKPLSLFLLDELDAADANAVLVMNGALANGALHIPQKIDGKPIKRGERAIIMSACNTWGTGESYTYAGRGALDGATQDRWYPVHVDYDAAFEAALAGVPAPESAAKPWKPRKVKPEQLAADVALFAQFHAAVRKAVADLKLHRIVSTRFLQKGIAALGAGLRPAEVRADLLASWTDDERARVLSRVPSECK